MAMNEQRDVTPKRPDLDTLDFEKVSFSYDRESDTLILRLFGRERTAVILPGNEHLDLWLDPETWEIIGFQIEGYLAHVVHEHPRFLELAELAGISADEVERIRRSVTPDKRKRAAVASLIGESLLSSA
ncbi:MAG TPA: hypothetical protein VLA19_00120 [Herpetosiphonaceae bacterium]|nr:hypothetical protein [Herpetosiphonaceae bacterium]